MLTQYLLTGTLVAVEELHIGGLGSDLVLDAPIATDSDGYPLIPGTSLAGVLRAELAGWDDSCWWGGPNPDTDAASRVFVNDAIAEYVVTPIRTLVGIDRRRQSAATGVLADVETVPVGTRFPIRIQVREDVDCAGSGQELIEAIALRLRDGLALGAKTGSGFGLVRLDPESPAQIKSADLATFDGLRFWLAGVQPTSGSEAGDPTINRVRDVHTLDGASAVADSITVIVPWRPMGPISVGERLPEHDADVVPRTAHHPGPPHGRDKNSAYEAFLIPGTSLRGVLRSQAERICRTVLGIDAKADDFLSQVAVDGFEPLVWLFGSADDQHPRRGAIRVSSSRSQAFKRDLWNDILTRPKAQGSVDEKRRAQAALNKAIDALNSELKQRSLWVDLATRNSIDRWTGGASDGALFSAIEVYATGAQAFEDLELSVRSNQESLTETGTLAGVALLLFVLRDLAEGMVRFGRTVSRGSGQVEVGLAKVRLRFPVALAGTLGLPDAGEVTLDDLLGTNTAVEALDEAWSIAVASHGSEHESDSQKEEVHA